MIALLYEDTTFHFRDLGTVSVFVCSILPQRLNSIRSVSIDWQISEVHDQTSSQKWNDVWETIATMQSIREVRLIVVAKDNPHWHEQFQWKWKHDEIARRIEARELRVDFWNFGVCIPAIFGEDERRNLPSTYQPPQLWGPEWYEPRRYE